MRHSDLRNCRQPDRRWRRKAATSDHPGRVQGRVRRGSRLGIGRELQPAGWQSSRAQSTQPRHARPEASGTAARIVPDKRPSPVLVNPNRPVDALPKTKKSRRPLRQSWPSRFVVNASTEGQLDVGLREHCGRKSGRGAFDRRSGFFSALSERIVALTLSMESPAIFENREYAEAGGLHRLRRTTVPTITVRRSVNMSAVS